MDDNSFPIIPGYAIEGEIAQGGMAIVYRATQDTLGRTVAIKVLHASLCGDRDLTERFLKEGRILASLRHPNIVTVYNSGSHAGYYYLIMEYLPGGTLQDRIEQTLSIQDAITILKPIAAALGYAHDKHYIHRDIKPHNIMFRQDGSPVLTDFGIAKGTDNTTQMTQVGTILGTLHYMSPEQMAGSTTLDARSDLYSLGVLFYHMLAGEVPFDGRSFAEMQIKHLHAPIPKLPVQAAFLQPVIERLLAKKPEDRYPSTAYLLQALETLEESWRQSQTGAKTNAATSRSKRFWLITTGLVTAGLAVAASIPAAWDAWRQYQLQQEITDLEQGQQQQQQTLVELQKRERDSLALLEQTLQQERKKLADLEQQVSEHNAQMQKSESIRNQEIAELQKAQQNLRRRIRQQQQEADLNHAQTIARETEKLEQLRRQLADGARPSEVLSEQEAAKLAELRQQQQQLEEQLRQQQEQAAQLRRQRLDEMEQVRAAGETLQRTLTAEQEKLAAAERALQAAKATAAERNNSREQEIGATRVQLDQQRQALEQLSKQEQITQTAFEELRTELVPLTQELQDQYRQQTTHLNELKQEFAKLKTQNTQIRELQEMLAILGQELDSLGGKLEPLTLAGIAAESEVETDIESTAALSPEQQQRISDLLAQIESPQDEDALSIYRQVLRVQPGNPQACGGLSSIAARYLEQAREQLESDPADALQALREGLDILPNDPRLNALRQTMSVRFGASYTNQLIIQAYNDQIRERVFDAWSLYRQVLALDPQNSRIATEIPKIARYSLRYYGGRADYVKLADDIYRTLLAMDIPLAELRQGFEQVAQRYQRGRLRRDSEAQQRLEEIRQLLDEGKQPLAAGATCAMAAAA